MEHLNRLVKTARASKRNFRHATLVIRGGAVIASACNTLDRHAEKRAIMKLWPNYARGSTIINLRLTRTGFGLARPCDECMELLRKEGVAKVIYSNAEGTFTTERI